MSTVRTILELREFYRITGYVDCVFREYFDELEDGVARASYKKALTKAASMIGTRQSFTTDERNEIKGRVDRVAVELISYRTDGARKWDHKLVGEKPGDASGELRKVLEAAGERGEPAQAPEKHESPAVDGAPAHL